MIEAIGLTKRYGSLEAIRDATFRVEDGEIVGFLGPNGAGKTTTMRILTGFSPASEGMAVVAGIDVQVDPIGVRSRVGYLPENVALYEEMRLDKYLEYVAAVKGVRSARRNFEVGRVIERCGLEPMGKRIIRHLSKGYRQRVGLAQALIGDPPVMIFDEPTVGLDPKQIIDIRQTIRELAGDHTVLLSTHILHEVELLCTRVVIINAGRIIAEQRLEDLMRTGNSITVGIAENPAQAESVLRGLAGVESVRLEAERRFAVSGAGLAPEQISTVLQRAGFTITLLEIRRRTLEDVFLESISTAGVAEPAA